MTFPRLQLSVIGDEIGPSLDEMISFAHEHGLQRLDMRTVGGRNLLGMKTEEVIHISRTLEKAGITVPAFVSPAFKWKAPGKSTGRRQGRFRLRSQGMPDRGLGGACHADRGDPGRTPHADFQLSCATAASGPPISQADRPSRQAVRPCRPLRHHAVSSRTNRSAISATSPSLPPSSPLTRRPPRKLLPRGGRVRAGCQPKLRYLRPLVDIANAWSTGERPSDADIAILARSPRRSISRTATSRPSAPCRWATAMCRGQPSSSAC